MWNKPTPIPPREIARQTLEREWCRLQYCRWIRVEGRSMGRSLPAGCWIQVRFTEGWIPRHGDLLYFRRSTGVRVVHRCVFRCGAYIIERGDANWRLGWCHLQDVLGTVCGVSAAAPAELGGAGGPAGALP